MIIGIKEASESVGKELTELSNRYVVLNKSQFKSYIDNGEKRYVGTACLLSDVGYDVIITLTASIICELKNRGCGALVVVSTSDYDLEELIEMSAKDKNFHVTSLEPSTRAPALHARLQDLKKLLTFRNNTSTSTFIWGIAKEDEEADAYTDNTITLSKDKETKDYVLLVDEDIINTNDLDSMQELLIELATWYRENNLFEQEQKVDTDVTLKNIYDSMDMMSGKTIMSIIEKISLYLILAKTKDCRCRITISR